MKAEDLTLEDLFGFTKGLVDLHGRRVIIQDLFTLTQFRRDLIEMVGWKQARRIFTRLGYFCGQADAGSMIRNFKWDDIAELLKTGQVLQMLQGVTKTELNIIRMDKEAGKYFFECIWHDSGEAEAYVSGLDYSEHSSCWKLVGYASGFTSFCLDRDIYFIEQKCRSQGDDICLAVGKDVDS